MLYLVSTPIGNLGDLSFRAIEVLKSSFCILCEDTRHSSILTRHYDISVKLRSFHKFSEASKEEEIIQLLKGGHPISLISDAGTPGICDPGERLVSRCVKEGIPVVNIPGACALVSALVCSGLPTSPFQFIGFFPKKESDLINTLDQISSYKGTSLGYVSPHHIEKVIATVAERSPKQRLVIARELTKKFEDYLRGSAEELLLKLREAPIKGEIVLLFDAPTVLEGNYWNGFTEEEHVKWVESNLGLERKEAIKVAAKERGISKRDLYRQLLNP